jgi:glycosyltransferase involved in cell wall biosynthesis
VRKNAITNMAGEETESIPAHALPRLLYLADVPVESSYHGSALVFRLLQSYPVAKLRIVETGISVSEKERRLPHVSYVDFTIRNARWLNTRFHRWVSSYFTLSASGRASAVPTLFDGFEPDAVLTVAHGYGWLTAAQYAREHKLPLHLIVHDDWPRLANVIGLVKKRLESTFGAIFRQAGSRLCVSSVMCETYRIRYGTDGTVLYPSRAEDCPLFDAPPERLRRNNHQFTVAFGGTINSPGYVAALKALATALERLGGRLLIFGPLTTDVAQQNDLAGPNIALCGLVTSAELMARFREEVDVLYVPMSFDSADRAKMEAGFPSKLADYTAVGLPLLIYGPPYCTAVRWLKENHGVAEVVETEGPGGLLEAIKRLADSPSVRLGLGEQALEVGRRYFALEAVQRVFHNALVLKPSQTN